jgi:hypothetical protein
MVRGGHPHNLAEAIPWGQRGRKESATTAPLGLFAFNSRIIIPGAHAPWLLTIAALRLGHRLLLADPVVI